MPSGIWEVVAIGSGTAPNTACPAGIMMDAATLPIGSIATERAITKAIIVRMPGILVL